MKFFCLHWSCYRHAYLSSAFIKYPLTVPAVQPPPSSCLGWPVCNERQPILEILSPVIQLSDNEPLFPYHLGGKKPQNIKP